MSSKSKKDTFKKGDRVQARWSGSNIFYDAKVVDVTSRSYKVQFDDGSVSSLKMSDVKKIKKSDTPPKTSKSRSRSRSSGRQTRSRSRSPSRREQAKREAKKEKKSPAKEVAKKSESTSNSNSVSKDETDSKTYLTREKISSTKSEVIENAKAPASSSVNSFTKELNVVLRRSEGSSDSTRLTRLSALKSENSKRLLESKFAERRNAKEAEKAKYSDDEEEEEEEEVSSKTKPLSKLWLTLYFFGTLLKMVLVPTFLLFLVFACTKKQCTVMDVPHFYSRLRDLLNAIKYPIACVFAFHLFQGLFSLVPLGRKVTGFSSEPNKRAFEYRLNGILSLGLCVIVFAVCAYFGVYMNWGYDKFRGIALSCAIYSIFCAVVLHIYSAVKGSSTTQTKVPILGKFYNGSCINPVLYNKLDIKTSFIRTGLIGSVILNLSILLKYFLMKGNVAIPLALTSAMQIFFVLDLFFREEKILSTATHTTDSLGYSFILSTGFVIPVALSLQTIYLFNYDTKSLVPHWCSAAMLCLFFVGYYIYLTSTNLKHNFRRNPFSPDLSDVTSIPTSKKKRLIASGWWGRVRHPNYLGLFIMVTAWTLPCGFTHVVPFGPLMLLALALIVRIFRIEAECKEKYGPAWTNYTEKVRSRILPYIF